MASAGSDALAPRLVSVMDEENSAEAVGDHLRIDGGLVAAVCHRLARARVPPVDFRPQAPS
jgi:hypothetical protein